MRRIIFELMLAFLAIGMLLYVFSIQPVRAWTGTVYIKADGSIDPLDAPIITYDNITYTLTGNITSYDDGIIVEKDHIVIDGTGFKLSGTGYGRGIDLSNRINVTVKNVAVKNFQTGIYLDNSNNTNIIRNDIEKNRCGICFLYSQNNSIQTNNIAANNEVGIYLGFSRFNNIFKNNVTNNLHGIFLEFSCNNTIFGNNIINNQYGVWLRGSNDSRFYHNNFIDNSQQIFDWSWVEPFYPSSINFWDDGYPSGGNYWSNYAGIDLYSGFHQNETGSDGICDSFYKIDENNQDNYPLMGTFYDFEVVGFYNETFHVQVISNSTVSELNLAVWLSSPNEYLQPGQEFLLFYVEGEADTSGFCRVTIPRALLNDSYIVLVDWTEVPTRQLDASNSTNAYLYFTYNHTKHEVIIIPEFPSTITLPCLMLTNLIATLLLKKRPKNKTQTF
jgi:parallel beta-helix repeat protein